jgi:hypothetical protein
VVNGAETYMAKERTATPSIVSSNRSSSMAAAAAAVEVTSCGLVTGLVSSPARDG